MDDTREVNNSTTINASEVLLKLSNNNVVMEVGQASKTKMEDLNIEISSDEIVAVVYQPFNGEIKGANISIFSAGAALNLCDLLAKRKSGASNSFSEYDIATFMEVGYIISSFCLNTLSKELKGKVNKDLPSFGTGKYNTILNQILSNFNRDVIEINTIEVKLILRQKIIRGYFFVICETFASWRSEMIQKE